MSPNLIAFAELALAIYKSYQTFVSNGRIPPALMALIRVEAFYTIVVGTRVRLEAELDGIKHLGSRASMVITAAEKCIVLLFLACAGVYLMNLTSMNDSDTANLLATHTEMVRTFLRIFLHSYSLL